MAEHDAASGNLGPIYEEFFRAVRAANASLPAERRLRVLLGDLPIDWDIVHSKDDLAAQLKTLDRDRFPAELIRREVDSAHTQWVEGQGYFLN